MSSFNEKDLFHSLALTTQIANKERKNPEACKTKPWILTKTFSEYFRKYFYFIGVLQEKYRNNLLLQIIKAWTCE